MKKIKDIRKRAGEIDYGSDESVRIMKKMTPGQDIKESKDQPPREYDYEGEMTKQQLRTIEMASKELQGMISDDQNLPEWWQNKITLAADYMQTARDYMKSDVKEGITQRDVDAGKMKPPSQRRLDDIRKDYEAKKKAKDDAISRLRGDKTEGKLTFAKVRKGLYKAAKTMGDVQAVRKGKVGKRVKRRILGKLAGKALGALTK